MIDIVRLLHVLLRTTATSFCHVVAVVVGKVETGIRACAASCSVATAVRRYGIGVTGSGMRNGNRCVCAWSGTVRLLAAAAAADAGIGLVAIFVGDRCVCGLRYSRVACCYYCGSSLRGSVRVVRFVVAGTVGTGIRACAGYGMVGLLAAATAGRRYVDRCCSCC